MPVITLQVAFSDPEHWPCPNHDCQDYHNKSKSWNFQVNGLSPSLRQKFINKMTPLKWTTLLPNSTVGQHQSLFFCICEAYNLEMPISGFYRTCKLSKLTKDLVDTSRFPMEFTTQILNIFHEFGFKLDKNPIVTVNPNKTESNHHLRTQQIWTAVSNTITLKD